MSMLNRIPLLAAIAAMFTNDHNATIPAQFTHDGPLAGSDHGGVTSTRSAFRTPTGPARSRRARQNCRAMAERMGEAAIQAWQTSHRQTFPS
jgi:hypothetical protein